MSQFDGITASNAAAAHSGELFEVVQNHSEQGDEQSARAGQPEIGLQQQIISVTSEATADEVSGSLPHPPQPEQ